MKRRILALVLIGLATTSCATGGSTPTHPPPTPPEVRGSSSPDVGVPTASATPRANADAHVAADLAFVRPVGDSGTSQVFVVDADGDIRQLTGLDSESAIGASVPVWSPDRRMVAFGPPKVGAGEHRFISIVNADGSHQRSIASLGDEFGVPFSWSRDGTRLLYFDIDAADGPAMWLAEVASGEVSFLGAGQGPRWRPDGHSITFLRAVASRDREQAAALTQTVVILDLDGGASVEFATASDALWSPDGSMVLLTNDDGEVVLANADGSDPRLLVRGWGPVWSPDGGKIVFVHDHNDDGVPLLAAVDREGQTLWSGVLGSSPSWSPDGTRLAAEILYPDNVVRVLDGATGEVLWETAGSQPAWAS
jgi:Tol biopolymer transport system component